MVVKSAGEVPGLVAEGLGGQGGWIPGELPLSTTR